MSNNIWCIISYRFVTDLKFESFMRNMYNNVSANVQLQIPNTKKPEIKQYLL